MPFFSNIGNWFFGFLKWTIFNWQLAIPTFAIIIATGFLFYFLYDEYVKED